MTTVPEWQWWNSLIITSLQASDPHPICLLWSLLNWDSRLLPSHMDTKIIGLYKYRSAKRNKWYYWVFRFAHFKHFSSPSNLPMLCFNMPSFTSPWHMVICGAIRNASGQFQSSRVGSKREQRIENGTNLPLSRPHYWEWRRNAKIYTLKWEILCFRLVISINKMQIQMVWFLCSHLDYTDCCVLCKRDNK